MVVDTGMIFEGEAAAERPGLVLKLLVQLREKVGTLKAKKKEGVKFKVRSLDELVDRIRPAANELGLLVYPVAAKGQGHVVEDGTLAEVALRVRIQAVEDGSYVDVAGFGLGADGQDKAGGKAGSYAFKTALVQALLAGGAEDTDDTDTPISGGVRAKKGGPKGPTKEDAVAALDAATDEPSYRAAAALVLKLKPDDQLAIRDLGVIASAKVRCGIAVPAAAQPAV